MEIKRCGNCGREVPVATQVGGKCPACGVRFDFERVNRGSRRSNDWTVLILIIVVLLITTAVALPSLVTRRHLAAKAAAGERPAVK